MLIEGLNEVAKGPDGEVLIEKREPADDPKKPMKEIPFTVRSLLKTGLLSFPEDKMTGAEKFDLAELARKICTAEGDSIELSVEDVKKIKDRVGAAFVAPAAVWAAFRKLDPKKEDKKEDKKEEKKEEKKE